MPRLKDRAKQIPNSLRFKQPETKWEPPLWASFDTIVDLLMQHRRANPFLANKNKWRLTRPAIADEVDQYNAKLCQTHGWLNFIVETEVDAPPKQIRPRSLREGASVAVGGGKAMTEWLGEGGKVVASEEAERRASICCGTSESGKCPQNAQGDWTRFFTTPAAAFVRKQLSIKNNMAIQTAFDEMLGTCNACGCPLKLKVWSPMDHILKHLSPEAESELDRRCWILKAKNG